MTPNRAAAVREYNVVNKFVAEPLMVAFAVVMGHEVFQRATEVPLAQRHNAIQTFLFDRANKPFCVRIAVRCPEGGPDQPHTGRFEHRVNGGAPFAIPITDQKPLAMSTPSTLSVRARAICSMNPSFGCGVEPTMWTRRECNSMTNNV